MKNHIITIIILLTINSCRQANIHAESKESAIIENMDGKENELVESNSVESKGNESEQKDDEAENTLLLLKLKEIGIIYNNDGLKDFIKEYTANDDFKFYILKSDLKPQFNFSEISIVQDKCIGPSYNLIILLNKSDVVYTSVESSTDLDGIKIVKGNEMAPFCYENYNTADGYSEIIVIDPKRKKTYRSEPISDIEVYVSRSVSIKNMEIRTLNYESNKETSKKLNKVIDW